jgi:hypothetical protein
MLDVRSTRLPLAWYLLLIRDISVWNGVAQLLGFLGLPGGQLNCVYQRNVVEKTQVLRSCQ